MMAMSFLLISHRPGLIFDKPKFGSDSEGLPKETEKMAKSGTDEYE